MPYTPFGPEGPKGQGPKVFKQLKVDSLEGLEQ